MTNAESSSVQLMSFSFVVAEKQIYQIFKIILAFSVKMIEGKIFI